MEAPVETVIIQTIKLIHLEVHLLATTPVNTGSNNTNNGTPKATAPTKSELQKNIERGDLYFNSKKWSVAKSYYEKVTSIRWS